MTRSLTAILLLLTAVSANAQEERAIDNFAGLGVRAMGMGGAYTGVADDFTAVFWNPAGLAQMQRREVYVAFLRNGIDNDATIGRGTDIEGSATADVTNTRFGSLGFVYPFPVYRGALVLAAGFNRVKDFDWGLHTAGLIDSVWLSDSFSHEGELSVTSIAAAIDVTPITSLGMTLSLISGEDDAVNEFVRSDTMDYFFQSRWLSRETFVDDYETTWLVTLGAMLREHSDEPRWRLGATVETGPTHKVSYAFRAPPDSTEWGRVEYDRDEGLAPYEADDELIEGNYEVDLPLSFGLGASFRPVPGLLLAGAVHATEWGQTEYSDADPFGLRTNASFETQYDDILRWHLGFEWQVPSVALDLRGGFYTDPLPFVGPRDPNSPPHPTDNPVIRILKDRSFWTLGAGLVLDETVRTDLAYTRGAYEQAEGRGEAELRENVTINRVFLGVAYEF